MQVSRRAAIGAAVSAGAVGAAEARETRRQPNIIFVLVDDLRFDALGFLRPGLTTPAIDRMARDGVHFRNAFVCTALCSPSRATILTGLPLREHRIVDNNGGDESRLTFFPRYLQQAGYRTAFIGKWHMGQDNDAPRPGFDKWVSFRGQGAYTPTSNVAPGQVNMLNVDGTRIPQRGYITDELTDYALDWMRAHRAGRDARRPFFCYISHKAVHAEFTPPERHASAYARLPLPRPASQANSDANYLGKPMWVRNQRNSWHGVEFPFHQTSFSLTDFERNYHRCLLAVDESMARIRAWLEQEGLAQDTIVFFMSDNGFMFGEHGLIDKRCAYEPSIRVPLLAWAPGRFPAGAVIEDVVANIDIAPTMLDLAGAPTQRHFVGRSFAPLARGEAVHNWNGELIYEYYWEFNHPHTPSTFAIRTDRWKYIQYHGVWDTEELYNVQQDPEEMTNRIDDPAVESVKIELRRRLFEKMESLTGEHSVRYSHRFNSGAVFRNLQGRAGAPFPESWLRDESAPDIVQHFVPDGPGKAEALRTMRTRRG